jgi:hypothetical protein
MREKMPVICPTPQASSPAADSVQAWTHFVGAGVQFVAGRAFQEAGLATARVAVGARSCDETRGQQQRSRSQFLPNHACTNGPGFFR